MIVMAFISTFASDSGEGVEVEYHPGYVTEDGGRQPAFLHINLAGTDSYLAMRVDEARALAEAVQCVVMLHDAAERLAAEKAVA
ncbi:hypothetical protein [Nocardia sp. alder85J]|uniref:hypothetical protein n=1 Tax=Nocardia sp. alder85J TaxID=2862949 RepID=UPI001CD78826|nr:hypothetical protein [Nocardia sp. alder85J]MCX4093667.1 hypothetical protein [Nocardia sp. alder85J]